MKKRAQRGLSNVGNVVTQSVRERSFSFLVWRRLWAWKTTQDWLHFLLPFCMKSFSPSNRTSRTRWGIITSLSHLIICALYSVLLGSSLPCFSSQAQPQVPLVFLHVPFVLGLRLSDIVLRVSSLIGTPFPLVTFHPTGGPRNIFGFWEASRPFLPSLRKWSKIMRWKFHF